MMYVFEKLCVKVTVVNDVVEIIITIFSIDACRNKAKLHIN